MMKSIVLTAASIVFASTFAPAQTGDLDICSKIAMYVRDKAPTWRLERRSRTCHAMSYFQWVSEKSYVYAFIYPQSSAEGAKEAYATLELDEELTLEKINIIAVNIDAVGEENRLWDTHQLKSVGMDFRQGKFVVRVGGSSMEEARKFAKYVADSVGAA